MKRRASNRLSIENLERRDLMAADAFLANGTLNIIGTEQADEIVVNQIASGYQVTIKDMASGNTLVQKSFATSTLNGITVECLGGNDVAINNTNKPSIMYGGQGNDRLLGGSVHDVIFGEAGDDEIWGRAGLDYMFGGLGFDLLDGEADNDSPTANNQPAVISSFGEMDLTTSGILSLSDSAGLKSKSGTILGLSGTDLGSGRVR